MTNISDHLLLEKFMSGKILLCWRYELLSKVARKRYLTSQDITRGIHGEIANLFFNEFSVEKVQAVEEQGKSHLRYFQNRVAIIYTIVETKQYHVYNMMHVLKVHTVRLLKNNCNLLLKQCNYEKKWHILK